MKDPKGHGSNIHGGVSMTPVHAHAAGTAGTPKLQRRHFEAIAAELKGASDAGSPEHTQRVKETADRLATTNPGFRRDFFIKAASGGDYRFKGPGKNAAAVQKKASKFGGTTGMSMSTKPYPRSDGSVNSVPKGKR